MGRRVLITVSVFLLFGGVSFVAFLYLPRLTTQGLLTTPTLDDFGKSRDDVRVNDRLFPDKRYGLIGLVSPDRMPDPQFLAVIRTLDREIAGVDGVKRVGSVASVSDVSDTGVTLAAAPLLPPDVELSEHRIAELIDLLDRNPFLSNRVRSSDGTAWHILVELDPEAPAKNVFARIERIVSNTMNGRDHDHVYLGPDWIDHIVESRIPRHLWRLGGVALAICALCFLYYTSRIRSAAAMLASVLVPTLWAVALFPATDQALTVVGLVVPFQALALATSYAIHVHRFAMTSVPDGWRSAAAQASPVVALAATTSIIGFLSLAVGTTPILRRFSTHFILAVVGAALAAILLLPRLAGQAGASRRRSNLRRVPELMGVIATAGALVLTIGMIRIAPSNAPGLQLAQRSTAGRYLAAARRHYGGDDELHVLLHTSDPDGYVDLDNYRTVQDLTQALAALPGVGGASSYAGAVAWMNGRLEGKRVPVHPASTAELGESLELLASFGAGLATESYLSSDRRYTRIVLRTGVPGSTAHERTSLIRDVPSFVSTWLADRGARMDVLLAGPAVVAHDSALSMHYDALRSLLVFIPAALLLLSLIVRSLVLGVILMFPAVIGAAAALGLVGWIGIPSGGATALMTVIMLGVGVDDAIFLTIVYRRYRSNGVSSAAAMDSAYADVGPAAVQTSVVLILCVLPLTLSPYTLLGQSVAVLAVGLMLALTMTLGLLPRLLMAADRRIVGSIPAKEAFYETRQ